MSSTCVSDDLEWQPVWDWRGFAATTVVSLIVRANGGRRPALYTDWVTVCDRLGVELHFADVRRGRGLYVDGHIFFVPGRTMAETLAHLCHEVSEYLLQSTHHAPYFYHYPGLNGEQDRHAVSRRVEKLLS